ncbi:hypothetical protein VB618_16760 [Microvirga sp. CF3062]|uniref:hypothetical protein n=1 Tax=Microvirga sp. CF3062 TaxID=3110182 RepID=UPI002E7A87D6|nr:hypothetical protein [Microvirga sp. CF3062]MEE1657854.1 hypothetical protein [Microvirga sp. CF3062]
MVEVYRIESVASEEAGGGTIRRILVRTDSLEKAKERALKVFSLARRPQSRDPEIESVRVLNGAGYEVFSISTRD